MRNKKYKKFKIPEDILQRLLEKKNQDHFKASLDAYIVQILDLVSRK